MKKRVIALLLVTTTVCQLCGCGTKSSAAALSLVDPLTKQEALDYYANGLKYDTVVSRGADDSVHETVYEEYQITGDKREKLLELQGQVESVLGATTYPNGTDEELISADVFNYVKAYLNDLSLSGGEVAEDGVTGALGYYFVDVKYSTSPMESGTFTGLASLVGVNGAFAEDTITGVVNKDDSFIQSVVSSGNRYFALNGINKSIIYSDETSFQIVEGAVDVSMYVSSDEVEDDAEDIDTGEDGENSSSDNGDGLEVLGIEEESNDTDSKVEDGDSEEADASEEETGDEDGAASEGESEEADDEEALRLEDIVSVPDASDVVEESGVDYSSNASNDRKVKFDINYLNSIVGSSADTRACMPELSTVYNIPSGSGTVNGVAIYPCGNDGMKMFGYDRSKTSGDITLRYVFKDSEDGSGDIIGVNIFPKEMTNNVSEFKADSNVLIPEYLQQEFDNLIERVDRVVVNYDLNGMISDSIFNDLGFGILRGYLNEGANVLKCMSSMRQIVSRDIENNAYVLEVETTIIEGARSCDSYGTYRDRSYVVVQQEGTDFKVVDWVRITRDVVKEPDIDADNSALKRLVALNLTGKVSESTRESAQELLNDLYTASTYRILNGPKDVETSDGVITLDKGMYDCFNNDVELLSTDKKETMNARLRGYLTAYGTGVNAQYIGKVDEWIGGAENQVEFTTEEIIVYGNMEAAKYLRTYYLMSSINDVWYIDEMTVLDIEDLEVNEIESTYSRISE